MSAYDKVTLARAKNRPTGSDYIRKIFKNFIELHGDRRFADDPSVVGGIAMLRNQPVTVIAIEKVMTPRSESSATLARPIRRATAKHCV